MPEDVTLKIPPGSTDGDTLRSLQDVDGKKWPVGVVAFATTIDTPDALQIVTAANPLPVTAAALPLPTGAATSALQGTGNTSLAAIQTAVELLDNAVAGNELQVDIVTLPALAAGSATIGGVNLAQYTPVSGRLPVDGSGVTQPVSLASVPSHHVTNAGTFAVQANQAGTWTVDLGATDNAVLDAIAASLAGTLTVGTHAVTQSGAWSVEVTSSALPTGAATAANQATMIASLASIDGHVDGLETSVASIDAKITACNTGAVVVASSALPSGAATAARQDTGNTSLGSIDAKTPALGQALAAASVPVVLTASQLSTLTPLATVAATQSGAWAVTQSGTWNVGTVSTVTNLSQLGGEAIAMGTGTRSAGTQRVTIATDDIVPVSQSGTWTVGLSAAQTLATVTTVTTLTSITNTVNTAETRPASATLANVTGTGSSVTIQASNANRRGLSIHNDSGVTAYIKCGSSASATSFTVKLVDGAYYELPQPCYTGIVTGLWASGDIRVTEFT